MKRNWIIVLSVIFVSSVLIYVFNPWRSNTKPATPKQEEVVVPPEVKPP